MRAPHGTFHLFSLAIPATADASRYFLYDSALRAGGQAITVSPDGISGNTELRLRAPLPTDPPILLAMPVLLKRAARSANPQLAPQES